MRTINKFLDPIIQAAVQRNAGVLAEKRGGVESHAEEGESLLDHLARHTDGELGVGMWGCNADSLFRPEGAP